MQVQDLELSGLKFIIPRVFKDARGFFFESHNSLTYSAHGISTGFVQDNVSFSYKSTVRGLHLQVNPGQAKLVTCLQGEIWDVAVDLRPESDSFMRWQAVTLKDAQAQLFIPDGFAHGFCVLSDTALVQYKVSSSYNPSAEISIRWNDPEIGIRWPVENPILSEKDRTCSFLKEVLHVVDHGG
jgi:dTDP-4-dehydrorhamnose 3,5-epimerase